MDEPPVETLSSQRQILDDIFRFWGRPGGCGGGSFS